MKVCKPDSHKTLYEWVNGLQATEHITQVKTKHRKGQKTSTYTYSEVNEVPLRDGDDALKVNWCELVITDEKGKQTYKNTFITNHLVTKENVIEIVQAGRALFQIENENNNILKTKGYNLEHNFGHGKKHLSSLLLTLNLLAFLVHTVMFIKDSKYQLIRQRLGTRKTFFNDIRALTRYFCFKSWAEFFKFMLVNLELSPKNREEIIPFDTG